MARSKAQNSPAWLPRGVIFTVCASEADSAVVQAVRPAARNAISRTLMLFPPSLRPWVGLSIVDRASLLARLGQSGRTAVRERGGNALSISVDCVALKHKHQILLVK